MTNKRGPKSQTLIMIPLSELVAKLPAGSNIKISRVWYEAIRETLGLTDERIASLNEVIDAAKDQIHVESLDLSDES